MAITVTHTKVSTVPDSADTSLVRPSDWNATHTLSGLGTAAELDAGVANGVASLDSAGKVPITELPAAVLGALSYQGTWNASTNTPTLASGVGTKGYYYVVDTAGSTNLDGITDWKIGDWAVYNGTAWQKIDNTDSVTSVNGYTGAVVLTQTDIAGTANAPTNTNITSMTGVTGGISSPDFVQFDTTVAVTEAVAKLQWDDGNGTLQFGLKGGNVNLQVGQELVARVYNDSGVALSDGQIVYISGAQGNRIAVKLARADSEATSKGTLGMVTESIAIGAEGFITIMGVVNKLNTTGLTAGNLLFLSATVAGAYTETIPTAPNHKVTIGYVERVDNIVGAIYVKVDNGYELDELHNVNIVTPTGGQLLAYDQTAGYWKNINLTDGTGISITEASNGAVTVTNSAPDQTVSLTGAGTTTISGTYPSFTITSNDQFTGTVTSVTGTAPVVSSGGNAPAISMAQATDSVDGYLSATDWTTFNGKANSFTYTSTYIPYGQGTTTPNQSANLTFDGTTQSAPIQRATNGIIVNSATVSANYTIPTGSNAMSAGPITVDSGITVTVSSGSTWVVV